MFAKNNYFVKIKLQIIKQTVTTKFIKFYNCQISNILFKFKYYND